MGKIIFAKDISLNTNVYRVTANEIFLLKPLKIINGKDGAVCIEIGTCFLNKFMASPNSTIFKGEDGVRYLNLHEAQQKQKELRMEAIQEAFEEMQKCQKYYQEVVEKYYDKPLSNPYK